MPGAMLGACGTHMPDALHERTNELTNADLASKTEISGSVRNARESTALNPADMTLWATSPGECQPTIPAGHCCVYFMWSSGWRLLYVGVTDDPKRRFAEHRRSKSWWQHVDHVEVERYPSRPRAFGREQEAIARWDPIHNIARPRVTR